MEAQLNLAGRALATQQFDEAEQALRRVLARRPDRADVRVLISQLAQERGDWATVAAVLRPIPASDPIAAKTRVLEGDAWLRLNRAVRAEECWSQALELDPEYQIARHRLIYLYGMQLRREPWTKLLWELHDRDQAGLREMIQLMVSGRIVWESHEALPIVREFVAADPNDVQSRRALGLYLSRAGKIADAIAELVPLCENNPADSSLWLALIEVRLASTGTDDARKMFDHAPVAATETAAYWKHRGSLALLDHRYAEAVGDFRRALSQTRYDQDVHHKLARAFRFEGDVDSSQRHSHIARALARVERLCHSLHNELSPSLEEIRQIIDHCEELQLIEEARGWVKAGLALAPDDTVLQAAQERLAQLPSTSSRHPPERP